MNNELRNDLEYVSIEGHRIHIYRAGDINRPKLIFMSGSGTVCPFYDFKILYDKLVSDYRIIVIEKFGYGYSDLYEGPCDIDSLIDYQKEALDKLDEKGPYILLPHSLSGLEAIRWKQKYPEEIETVIGLDMALPKQYLSWGEDGLERRIDQMMKFQKLHKKGLMFWYPLYTEGLNKEEKKQLKILYKRNGFNDCFINEARVVLDNARKVEESGDIDCPILQFVSNGKEVSANWINYQKEFSEKMKSEIISLDCGHYIHHYESERISKEIRRFIDSIKN